MTTSGKIIRMNRMFDRTSRKIVLVPLDDALLAGPEGGLRDAGKKVKQIVNGGANAIMGFRGLFDRHYEAILGISGILNVTASTTRSRHTRKVLVSSVEDAVKLGMDGVGVHVNISSEYESEMLRILGEVSRECERLGMPLMGIMYPRSERKGEDYNYEDVLEKEPERYSELVRHATRVGVELGADIIKTQYTGSPESFSTVVESCSGVPILIAGGPKVEARKMLEKAKGAIQGGASGVSFGRNVFNREDSTNYIKALAMIVHKGASAEEAMQTAGIEAEKLIN